MPLTLRVVRYQQRPPDQPYTVSFGPRGGTIGRAPGNDWVLPDPKRFVSSRHAAVYRQADGYHITDTSANGVYLNGSPRSLGRGGSTRLGNGDHLVLGEYEIAVSETPDDAFESTLPAGPGASVDGHGYAASLATGDAASVLGSATAETVQQPKRPRPLPGREAVVDIGQGGIPVSRDSANADSRASPGAGPSGSHSIAGHGSSVDFDPLVAQTDAPASAPGVSVSPAAALLRAASVGGLDPQGPDATLLLERAGAVLAEATRGLTGLLRARSELKELVRAERTLYWQSGNPLQNLALKPEEALRVLLDPAMAAEIDAGASVRQVADDLKSHERALMAGMYAAFRSLITRFEPSQLEQRLQRATVLDRMLPATRKARNWDLYVENYEEIAAEMEDALRNVLRDEFAKAYDREVRAQRQFGPRPAGATGES